MQSRLFWALVLLAMPVVAAERVFDFSQYPANQSPPGFRSLVTGQGKPGDWRVIREEAASASAATSAQAPATGRAVLAQLSQDRTDEHFPLLCFEDEIFADFTLTTHFKTVAGAAEQMAGIAFRIQNETNYYVVRASSLGNNLRFYKVVDGERGTLIGPQLSIPTNVWQELSIECQGNQFHILLNGKEVMPALHDSTFASGKVGFWTKSDSVSYFGETKLVYTPREVPARAMVRDLVKKYPRLLGLEVFVPANEKGATRLLASKKETEIGRAGGKTEQEVISQGTIYYGKETDSVSVVLPLRDRNGDPMAAVRVVMKTFKGQTEQNAIIRATPIVKEMQEQAHSLEELL
jgi:hypothetical protein